MIPSALTIAGSDPSGGAGLQADLKTFHQFGVYGQSAVTLITVQNTRGVTAVHPLDPALVIAQVEAVLSDIRPNAVKMGALADDDVIRRLAHMSRSWEIPLVVDPVLFSKNGTRLSSGDLRPLLPNAALITPNLAEAAVLTGLCVTTLCQMREAARSLAEQGARSVLIKGGHLSGAESTDIFFDRSVFHEFPSPRIVTPHTHGTGCTYSAAITALLACGLNMRDAVARAKHFITEAIRTNPGLGAGQGPVNHWA